MQWPEAAVVCEVGPRDGFQMETTWIPTDTKVRILSELSRTGLRCIQATSFVHPRAIPQLRDADEVMARLDRVSGVRYTALVPNERGVERAIAARTDGVEMVVSVSDSHCLSNTNMTTEQAIEIELECYRRMVDHPDRHEGVAAFNERRPPKFQDAY